ncbi:hypothetical protein RSO41_16845 [Halomonas sp. I1]|uniref:hypothetical protein n=1 Tax=Halomonas sp. I1 TaxID=393536 RepID=UPI0028DFCD96|nr:hypothetical protein [Halomonas sp. I1]MDT8896319.1 hypothetical protein [Halomonas sp. I1]
MTWTIALAGLAGIVIGLAARPCLRLIFAFYSRRPRLLVRQGVRRRPSVVKDASRHESL